MSAAARRPPPSLPDLSSPHGHGNTYNANNQADIRSPGASNNMDNPPPSRAVRHVPHIQDLQAKAAEAVNPNLSIARLLEIAKSSSDLADTLLEYKRPDQAYVEYLKAFEIVVASIPRHPEAPTLYAGRGRQYHANKELLKRVNQQHEQFARVKDAIVEDNRRTGVQPQIYKEPTSERPQRPSSQGYSPTPVSHSNLDPSARPASSHSSTRGSLDATNAGLPSSLQVGTTRPAVHAKPPALQGHALANTASAPNDSLTERFARLRAGAQPSSTLPDPLKVGAQESGDRRPSASAYNSLSMPVASDYSQSSSASAAGKPQGPRGMPSVPPVTLPPTPPKIPLKTQFSSLPKAPSPTYSPSTSTGQNASASRNTAKTMAASGRSYSNSSAQAEETHKPLELVKSYPNGATAPAASRRKSVYRPRETRITAERLYDYLKMYNILLIDLRPREAFDHGHIFAQSIMCVEPTALRPNMSAEELLDSLVLSPDSEQAMFDRRDHFDLVVFYDQSTSTDRFLRSYDKTEMEMSLKCLHDALYEFNQEKPLQRPPILLIGGIDGWVDLIGEQALKTSSTAGRINRRPVGPGAVPGRRAFPPGKTPPPLVPPKRRLREYNPLDADEEKNWLERARAESVTVPQAPPEHLDEDGGVPLVSTPIVRDYEAFLRRFPEVSAMEQQSMVAPPVRAAPPVPRYEAPPVPSIPSRPAPAAPRPSYSGVSDRSTAQATPISRSQELPSYVPPKLLPQNLRIPRTGLVNFGQTCYMNSTIQCLSATTPMSLFFMDDNFKNLLQRDNFKGSKGLLPEFYAITLRNLWQGDVEAIRPSSFRKFCARLNRDWGEDQQQDAKEFFDFLMGFLHEDFNVNWNRALLRKLTPEEEKRREAMPKLVVAKTEWQRYTHRDQSFIYSLFAGQYASKVQCLKCGFTSTTYDAFTSLSIEIPKGGTSDLSSCLRSFCSEEKLTGAEAYNCPSCKVLRDARKQITITRAPEFLVIHFKRFSAGHGQASRKIHTPVAFPLRNFDLGPFVLPTPTRKEAAVIGAEFGDSALTTDTTMTPPYLYDAYAVLRHIGNTMSSGHYISCVRDQARKTWRSFDDTTVRDFDPSKGTYRLDDGQAYIVFFQRVNTR